MVIRAQHVDAQVEAAGPLVQEVREIACDVGGVTVGLDDDPVLVVAVGGRIEPPGAVLERQVPGILQPLHRCRHGAALVQRVLVEVDVEVGAEQVQGRLDLVEHQLGALVPVQLGRLVVRQGRPFRMHRGDPVGDLGDVVAAVAVVRGRQPAGRRQQRAGEPVDLRAGVVEVVLPDHLGALGAQHPPEGVADGRPPGAADVHRAGRVGRDELQVDVLARERVTGAVGGAGGDDLADQRTGSGGFQGDVEETRTGDLDGGDARCPGQVPADHRGDLPGRATGCLRQLQRDGRRVVAVLAGARTIERDVGGDVDGQVTGLERRRQGMTDGIDQLRGIHPAILGRPSKHN